ncbi:MAG: hypothetical protein QNJ00_08415 [Woeseiaceae bacterium]|nr:hypothetical protein [Woeseiaceae bacterium]
MNSEHLKPVCLWSGPRNVSTALMYSFAQNPAVAVVDEPLYGHYLHVSGADHPGRDEVIAAMNCDGNAVMRELIERQKAEPARRLFIKQMAHHLVDIDLGFLSDTRNIFLVRDPREMLPSLTIQVPHAQLADTGLKQQWELTEMLEKAGESPVVLDSRELLLSPPTIIRQLCDALDIEYSDSMLGWPAGPIPEDGVWAPHWYHAVHKSTGFAPYVPKTDFPPALEPLLLECQPWYDKLYERALKAPGGDSQ